MSIVNPLQADWQMLDPIMKDAMTTIVDTQNNIAPVLNRLKRITWDWVPNTAEASMMEYYKNVVQPNMFFGDRLGFIDPSSKKHQGQLKFKKFTQSLSCDLDTYRRYENGATLLSDDIRQTFEGQMEYSMAGIERWIMTPPVAGQPGFDPLIPGIFGLSAAGTITNPSDLGAAAVVPTATILAGAARTPNNIETILQTIEPLFTLQDVTRRHVYRFPRKQIIMDPAAYTYFKLAKDEYNAITFQRSEQTIEQLLNSVGYELIPSINAPAWAGPGAVCNCIVTGEIDKTFAQIELTKSRREDSTWHVTEDTTQGVRYKNLTKGREWEMTAQAIPFFIPNSEVTDNGAWFKAMAQVSIRPI